jgi:hypothetical protein
LALAELATPDLDLIKQEEQEYVTSAAGQSFALCLRLREGDEFAHPQDFPTTSFAGRKRRVIS